MGTEVPHLVATLLAVDAPLEDLGPMVASAAAELFSDRPEATARLDRKVKSVMADAMLQELVMAAPEIYAEASQRFEKIAKEATAAWATTAPDATAESLIGPDTTEEQRVAFHAGQDAGWRLEAAIVPLIEAARAHPGTEALTAPFAGKVGGWPSRIAAASAGVALVVKLPEDRTKHQKILDTWRAPRDGRRWGSLYQLGCRFGAVADPAKASTSMPAPPPPVTPVNGATGRTSGPKGKDLLGTAPDGTTVARPFVGRGR